MGANRPVPQADLDAAFAAVEATKTKKCPKGSETAAAKALGISRSTLQSRLELRARGSSAEALDAGRPTREDRIAELALLLSKNPAMSERQFIKATAYPEPHWHTNRGGWSSFKTDALRLVAPHAQTEGAATSAQVFELKDKVRTLTAQLAGIQREQLTDKYVREKVIGLSEAAPSVPEWVLQPRRSGESESVPTLFLSDLHWGEVVDPAEVHNANEYNLAIAHDRLRMCATSTIDLLRHHFGKMRYPGIVMPLGGDIVSGDIHEELTATNALAIMPTVLDVWGALVWMIETMADEFGRVFLPCVTGNHGRSTKFIRAKGRCHTSYEWLLYHFLAKHFEKDARIQFMIPTSPDCLYQVYGHRYLLTHGDQFRGGDGIIGPLGPLTRGNKKKQARNVSIHREYDTMIAGHWHTYISLMKLIVNSSLKGYDEYAASGNFDYEPPQQALWLTHPQRRITIAAPVQVDPKQMQLKDPEWVKWAA